MQAEQITEFEKKSVDKQRQYRSSEVKSNVTSKTKTLVKSNFTSNDDTKPKNSVELNALDELLDSVILETSTQSKLMEKQSAVLSLENDLDDLLSSGIIWVSNEPRTLKFNFLVPRPFYENPCRRLFNSYSSLLPTP